MARDYASIDISAGNAPGLTEVADEVHRTSQPRVPRRADEEIAVLLPAPKMQRICKQAKPVTEDDALFRGIGSGASTIAGGVSGKKHEYLLRAKRGQ